VVVREGRSRNASPLAHRFLDVVQVHVPPAITLKTRNCSASQESQGSNIAGGWRLVAGWWPAAGC
jgi:hypothetical protein